MNLGVEQHDVAAIQKCSVGGIANNRSMTFQMQSGNLTLRISPWFKTISGTKDFFEQVPNLINSGQLAQLAAAPQGYAAMPQGGYAGAPQLGMPQQAMGMPQQAMAMAAPVGIGPGTRVLVTAGDGNRYPATVMQEQGGHYLCATQDGQQHWFPTHAVAQG
jgi:hypothetical protein